MIKKYISFKIGEKISKIEVMIQNTRRSHGFKHIKKSKAMLEDHQSHTILQILAFRRKDKNSSFDIEIWLTEINILKPHSKISLICFESLMQRYFKTLCVNRCVEHLNSSNT